MEERKPDTQQEEKQPLTDQKDKELPEGYQSVNELIEENMRLRLLIVKGFREGFYAALENKYITKPLKNFKIRNNL